MGEISLKSKGSSIYLNDQPVTEVSLLLSGKVTVTKGNNTFTAGPGELIGILDLMNKTYEYSYVAAEDSRLITFSTASIEDFTNTINSNNIVRGSLIMAIAKYCKYLSLQYNKLHGIATSVANFIIDKQKLYLSICSNNLISAVDFSDISSKFLAFPAIDVSLEIMEYYNSLSKIDKKYADTFFAESAYITSYHFSEAYELAKLFSDEITLLSEKLSHMYSFLLGSNKTDLYALFANLYTSLKDTSKDASLALKCMDSIISYAKGMGIDAALIDKASCIIKNLTANNVITADSSTTLSDEYAQEFAKFKEATTNALDKLLSYSDLSEEITAPFKEAVLAFRALKNKNNSSDNVLAIRKTITKHFYTLYEAVFFKYAQTGAHNRLIELFLNTCFVDETLISDIQLKDLFNMSLKAPASDFKVYTMYEWLFEIFKGNKEPSRNEFDMDYTAMVRERKRTEKLSDTQVNTLLNDRKGKVRYEIQNFFRSTHRITCGQIIGFCPILYSEYDDEHFSGMFLSKDRISQVFDQYRKLDFSCFYRVVPYEVNRYGLTIEHLQTEITPYIILTPVIGQKGIMWQEISGTKRDTPGRFAFPIFFRGDINPVVLNTLGQYRWALCKSIEGIHWNDMQHPSLTAEFYDYISFYKKNSALSPEAKEKVKTILTKYHNSAKDVFAHDYATYMQYESKGASRLNRLSRAILFKYCPFDRDTRTKLLTSPNFKDLIDKYAKKRTDKLRRITSVINLIQNGAGSIPHEFEVNRDFYNL